MNLKDEIRKLAQVQTIDSDLYCMLQRRDKEIPATLNELKKNLDDKGLALAALENDLKQLLLKKKDAELELAAREDLMKKAEAQMYLLKSNKEYQARLSEIATHKADVSLLEEKVLKALEGIENAEKVIAKAKEEFSVHLKKFLADERELKTKLSILEGEIALIQDKRSVLSRDVDKTVFAQYEGLVATRGGLAMAAVAGDTCGACHMNVNHQKINAIKMYDRAVLCDSCARLLYIPEDLETA